MKKYADRYIRENYLKLAETFREHDSRLNEKGDSPLDRLNDTMLTLYDNEETFISFEAFCDWADQKFGKRTKRRTRKVKKLNCTERARNTGS